MLFLDRSCFLNKNKNHHLGYEKSGFSWLLMEIYDEPFLFQEQVGLKLLGRQVKNHRVAMFFSFPWAWPINQSQLVTYQQALGEPDERREAVSGAVGEAGSDCESKLHLLKRPDVNQLTLLTSSTLLLRILVFMLQKIQAIFFLPLETFGSAACRLGKICRANLQRVIFSRFSLQLQKAGGSFGLEMDSNNSTSFRLCRRLALFQCRSFRHIATSFTKLCVHHPAYANIAQDRLTEQEMIPPFKCLLLFNAELQITTLLRVPRLV